MPISVGPFQWLELRLGGSGTTNDNEPEDTEKRWTRRGWVKAGLAIGGTSAAAALVGTFGPSLLGPERTPGDNTIRYTRFPTDQWWNDREGKPVRVTDFAEWQGATGVWRGNYVEGKVLSGTGYPVLAIRVKRDDSVFSAPLDVAPPVGFGFYYDDPDRNLRIVVVYDRCAHLCCFPGWQVIQEPPPSREYVFPTPTYEVFGLDPIYCVCHGSQYDPLALVKDVNPENGVEYVGPRRVHGPSTRAIPVVPVRAEEGVLVGAMPDPRWYEYC